MRYTRLLLRNEEKPGERRVALTPEDAARLLEATKIPIQVESSATRAFADSRYEEAGCGLVPARSWRGADGGTLVLGLKELGDLPNRVPSDHVFFSHCYRGQHGAEALLNRFSASDRRLFDLEYLVDDQGRRKAAFGYWAGYVGAALGVLDYYSPLSDPLSPFSREGLLRVLASAKADSRRPLPTVCVTGARGRAGRGATELLEGLGIPSFGIDLHNSASEHRVREHQILIHCVGTGNTLPPIPALVSEDELGEDIPLRHLVDVTCDFTSAHHRFPFYRTGTTLERPVRSIGGLRVIAIDHLPTLLPRESSEEFSAQLWPLLADLLRAEKIEQVPVWRRSLPEANR